ncbi:MAG: hypothetical protein Q8P26_04845 [Candidatus Levybacteria bacterium]|nr:hypothetical protein [Candidatus Levybacteria bacterium]
MQVFLEIALFIIAIFVCFYLPGKFLFTKLKLKLNSPENIFLPFALGIVLFTLISYMFSWIRLEVLILPILLIINLFVIKSKNFLLGNIEKNQRWPLLALGILSIIFSFSMLTAGVYEDSISYRRDDIWHLALINELKTNFPPDHPGFAQVSLKGYHFFYNFVLAKISNIFFISPTSLHFHYFPLFIAFLWALGVYSLMYKWSKKISIGLWAVFLTQLGGSFAFILRLRGHENLSLDSAFGIQQPISSLINPPFSISIVIVITVLFFLYQYLQSKENKWLIPVVLCIGFASMFKVYAGIILLGGFLIFTFLQLFKKNFILVLACFFIGLLFMFTYWIFSDPSSKLIFAPLWAPHKVLLDNMPWYGYDEKMHTYTKLSVLKGVIETELYSWYVFLFGNLGTRLIGLLFLPFLLLKNRKLSFFAFMILSMTMISILIPLFFIQSGKVFEIIQMAWYFLFFISLIAAFGFYKLFSFSFNRMIKVGIFIIILILTLPSAYDNFRVYLSSLDSSAALLSSPYFKSMQFLRSEGSYNETIIEIPEKGVSVTQDGLMRWYRSSTPSIVAFSNKRSYLSNEYIDFAGLDYYERIEFIGKIISFNNLSSNESLEYVSLQKEIKEGLRNNKISFIYSPYPLLFFEKNNFISKIYENRAASIYRVE